MNGLPIISPWNSASKKCPFNFQLAFAVPWVTFGGPPGSHQHFTSAFQFPTKASSALCAGPGVPAASIFFIISALSASDFPEPDFALGRSRTAVLPASSVVCFIIFSFSCFKLSLQYTTCILVYRHSLKYRWDAAAFNGVLPYLKQLFRNA